MQANWREITAAFSRNNNYVLATIVATRGATYQKPGAMMLINEQGECFGLLSGGCLEADISLHAKQVLLNKRSEIIKYDLSADADLLWGLGLGCDGAIDILLLPLLSTNNHLDFAQLLKSINAQQSGYYRQYLPLNYNRQEFAKETLPIVQPYAEFILSEQLNCQIPFSKSNEKIVVNIERTDKNIVNQLCFVSPIKPPINLLICGAGPDVVPVAMFAQQMGWKITLWDHRKNHLQQQCFNDFEQRCIRAKDTSIDDYNTFNAAIVMTHNLTMDSEYLAKLIASSAKTLTYIGLLGPKARRDKLLSACDVEFAQVQQRVYGPVGLNLGGRGAQAIALSIISEIQQHFFTTLSFYNQQNESVICNVNNVKGISTPVKKTKASIDYV